MKKTLLAFIVCLFILMTGCSRKSPNQSEIKIKPNLPKRGETLTVYFTPGINSPLLKSKNIVLQAFFLPANPVYYKDFYNSGKMNEIPMQKKGVSWITKIVPEEYTGCIVFQFEADDKFDNNNKKGWDMILYTETGKPVRGACSALSQTKSERAVVSFLMDLDRAETDTALALYEKEIRLYPDNWKAKAASINLRAGKAKKDKNENELAKINAELDLYLAEHPENLSLLELIYSYYYRSKPEKSAQVLKQIEKLDPQHTKVLFNRIKETSQIQDMKKRLGKLKSWEKGIWETDSWPIWYFYTSKALSALQKWESLHEAAEKMINKIETDDSGYAVYTKKKKEQNKKSSLFSPLSDMAQAHFKLGNKNKAEECYEKLSSFELNPRKGIILWENYLQFLVESEQWIKAVDIGQKAIEKAQSNDKIVEYFKTAYTEKTGNVRAAEQMVVEAKKKAGTFRREEISNNLIVDAQPAPEFTLKNLQGEEVSLASLRGKTVIVDFWATWCSPCKASFPYLQKFWEEHQNNPKIAFFAVNTSEQLKGEARVKAIKKFMTENKYTFPVLLDDNDSSVKKAFEVGGIPTKFFIGPDGKIYFKEIGFHGPGMMNDMNIQLEMIKERVRSVK